MSRKSKIDPIEKAKAVEDVLTGKVGINERARQSGVSEAGLENWIAIYKSSGPSGLLNQKHNKVYSQETMLAAVNDYLSGNGSLMAIVAKYGLRSKHPLQNWIKKYNTQGTIKSRGSGGGSYLKKRDRQLLRRGGKSFNTAWITTATTVQPQ